MKSEARLHKATPMSTYLAWNAVSASDLTAMRRSPAYCHWRRTHPREDTVATAFGTAAHCAILEPDQFELRYRLDPMCPERGGYPAGWRNTKDYKAAKADLIEHGFTPLSQHDLDSCRWIRDNVSKHRVGQMIASTQDGTEISAVAYDPEFNVYRKVRPDILIKRASMVVDVKTEGRDHSPEGWARLARGYGYHRSGPYYLDTLALLQIPLEHYVYLVVMSDPPHEVRAYTFDNDSMLRGREEYRVQLARFAECEKSGEWPGPSGAIEEIRLPEWAFNIHPED